MSAEVFCQSRERCVVCVNSVDANSPIVGVQESLSVPVEGRGLRRYRFLVLISKVCSQYWRIFAVSYGRGLLSVSVEVCCQGQKISIVHASRGS